MSFGFNDVLSAGLLIADHYNRKDAPHPSEVEVEVGGFVFSYSGLFESSYLPQPDLHVFDSCVADACLTVNCGLYASHSQWLLPPGKPHPSISVNSNLTYFSKRPNYVAPSYRFLGNIQGKNVFVPVE